MRRSARVPWLVALGLVFGVAARAQSPAAASGVAVPPIYVDRVIEGLAPLDEGNAAVAGDYNSDGWARQLRFETRIGQDSFAGSSGQTSTGLALYGLIETPNYGILSIDAQSGTSPSGGLVTVRQRALPFGSGWLINNEAGVIASPAPTIMRTASRVFVPGFLLTGVSTEWLNDGGGLQLQASTGRPGRLDGTLIGRFRELRGEVTTLGAQVGQGPWTLAARVAQSHDVSLDDFTTPSTGLLNASSTQLTARHDSTGRATQVNFVTTRDSLLGKTPSGLWIDSHDSEGVRGLSTGLFWLDPGLSWAGQPMASDLAGAYVGKAWQSRQWSAEGTLDLLRKVSTPSNTGIFATGSARWRYSRSVSVAAGAALRHLNGNAWSTYGEVRWQNGWGSSGLRFDLSNEQEASRVRQLTLNQDWDMSAGWSLGTSLTAGQTSSSSETQTLWGAAASISAPLNSRVSLRGNMSLESAGTGNSRLAVNTGLSWRLTPQWSLDGNYNVNQGKTRLNPTIDPLAPPLPLESATSSARSLFIALRWEARAGTSSAPLGGSAQQGGARIEGVVFFDANNNGRQDASETGAGGVTVFLDNRYAARTDPQGRYYFAFVGTGQHVITVQSETLPLPWVASAEGRVKLEVRPREDQRIDFAVRRQGSE
jgi:hypothetical protein